MRRSLVSVGAIKAPHGLKCGVLVPFGIEFNMPVCEAKFAHMAVLLGESAHDKTPRELAELFLWRVKQLYMDIDFPRQFAPEELPEEKIPQLIKEARSYKPGFLGSNLRHITDADIERICKAALEGWDCDLSGMFL